MPESPAPEASRGDSAPDLRRAGSALGLPGWATALRKRLTHLGQRASQAFDRLPIRVRLAATSALLTFTILCVFALVVGSLTAHRIRSDFNREVAVEAANVANLLRVVPEGNDVEGYTLRLVSPSNLDEFAGSEHAAIRILTASGTLVASTRHAPEFKLSSESSQSGYRVNSRLVPLGRPIGGAIIVQYARPLSEAQDSVARVELFLVLGVFGGTALALLAGAAIARRAMAPIAALTRTAEEIARTRDPSRSVPQPQAEDEVAELARTLGGMLRELEGAHAETEATLERQRQFVADASHELRTPLTSVLANLELLAESLHGDEAEAASSALRSSRRMRRLVADLLLLARTDVGRIVRRERCDLAQIVVEAAAEVGSVATEHEISLDARPVMVEASRDELHRLTINLIENAIRHTPPGTEIRVCTRPNASNQAVLVVEDDGPGIPSQIAPTLFERFVRGAGDRGGSFGLGLAIVRAVAEAHGGSVVLSPTHPGATHPGARFTVTLPAAAPGASDLHDDRQHHRAATQAVVD